MISFEDFLVDKKAMQGGGMYKHLEYNDPSGLFNSELNYDYRFGWGCKVYFPKNPSIGIYFEDGNDQVQSVLDSLNICIPYYKEFTNLRKIDKTNFRFPLKIFTEELKGRYVYKDSENKIILNINYNGKNYCEASIFLGNPLEKNISIFFEYKSIQTALNYLNSSFPIVKDMYNKIINN